MREGYSKREVKSAAAALFFLYFLAFSYETIAQGGDGRPDTAHETAAKRSFNKRATRKISNRIPRITPTAPVQARPGTLSAVINESDSRVYLSTPSNSEPSFALTTPRQRYSFWRMLPPGRYILTVKKPGFFEEVRSLDINERGRYRLAINLRPQMAILNIRSNIPDAEIEIERIGNFKGPLKKHLLMPGKYPVHIRRRGYAPQTVVADLSIAGKEQNFYVVLKPLPIDSLLNDAASSIAKGELERAAILVSDVLQMNAAHARANMTYGFIEMKRGNAAAAEFLHKAISGGETVSIPAKTVFSGEVADIVVAINRDAIAFRSRRIELNFRFTRSNLEELNRLIEADSPAYVAVKGESDFFGKGIHPNLKIFSAAARFDPASGLMTCHQPKTCAADIEVLYNVISGWRDMSSTAVKK